MTFWARRDDGKCLKHADGKHCWHQNGAKGFSGKTQVSTPVKCCHCQKTATHVENQPNPRIEYD